MSYDATFKCPISSLLDLLAARWTVELMREMSMGPVRTRRFLALIPGLTMKCLRQRLMQLEKFGFVHREQFDERPLRVEYSITPKGKQLLGLLNAIKLLADEFEGKACSCPMELDSCTPEQSCCPRRRQDRSKCQASLPD